MENKYEIFILVAGQDGEVKESLGTVPAKTEEFESEKGTVIRVDLSGVNTRLRGPKIVSVQLDGLPPKQISVNRITGRGLQTLGTGTRLGIEFYDARGITLPL